MPLVASLDSPAETSRTPARTSGVRSSALIAAASVVATVLNYAFLLSAGRLLGSDDYGALAALMGLLTLVLLPTGAIQLAVSREISRSLALDERDAAAGFARAVVRVGLIATIPVVVVGLALAVPLREILNIDSRGAVALALTALAAALVFPIATGVLQGYHRFQSVAAMFVLPFGLRLGLLAVSAALGYGLGGAVLAAVLGSLATTAIALALLREPLRQGARAVRPSLQPFFRYLWPVAVGVFGIAVLTNVDLLVVKARFSGDAAGEYAAAAAFAKVAFFLPATILAVLFPRTAARHARGESTDDILGRSLIVTAGFGTVLTLFYAMAGRGLVHTSFGAEFAPGGELLVPFTLAMTLFALANVLVGFHLSRGQTAYAWMVAVIVPVQVVLLAIVPGTPRAVIWTDFGIAIGLLAAHELVIGSSVPALWAGVRQFATAATGIRVRRIVLEGALALVGTTLFVCLLFLPLVLHLGSMIVGNGSDSSGQIAEFWWMQHEGGYQLFGTVHHTLTGAPFGWDAGNGVHIQALLPYYPAYLLTKVIGPIAAFNVVLLAGYVLSSAAMYGLARYLRCSPLVAAWAALVYIVFPWHLVRTPHPSLVHLEFLPILVFALLASFSRPTWPRLSLVGVATLAAWITAGYFGAMAFITTAAFGLGVTAVRGIRRSASFIAWTLGSAVAASLFVAFLSIVSGFGRGAGLHRVASDLAVFGVRPLELLLPTAGNFLVGDRMQSFFASRLHGSNPTETSDYLGWLTTALAVGWLVFVWRRWARLDELLRAATAGLFAIAVAALLLAAPSPVHVLGVSIPMPSRAVWAVIPAIRVPARGVALVMTALVPLAALGLQALTQRRGWHRALPAAFAVVPVAMVISFFELAVDPTEPNFRTTPLPPEYAALEQTPNGIVAEYPLVVTNDHIIWQTLYKRPLLNNADFGTPADDARRSVLDPASSGAAEDLAFLGVTAIVTHANALRYRDGVPDVPNASWGPGYQLVGRSPDGSSTWKVVAPAAAVLVTVHSGFGDPSPPQGHEVPFPLLSPSGVGYLELRARQEQLVRLTFDATPPSGSRRVLRIADASNERPYTLAARSHISLLVRVPAGLSSLLVKTDPAATSEADAIFLTVPRAERASGSPDLVAQPVSPDIGF